MKIGTIKKIESVDDIYPLTIISDRYGGTYSNGKYLAFNTYFYNLERDIAGDDTDCNSFWCDFEEGKIQFLFCGKGNTPEEAINQLLEQLQKAQAELI